MLQGFKIYGPSWGGGGDPLNTGNQLGLNAIRESRDKSKREGSSDDALIRFNPPVNKVKTRPGLGVEGWASEGGLAVVGAPHRAAD